MENAFRSTAHCTILARRLDLDGTGMTGDWNALRDVLEPHLKSYAPRQTIVSEGERTDFFRVILSGWACCSKELPNGRRQILAFLLPGDLCDPFMYLLPRMDYSASTITDVLCAEVPKAEFERLLRERPHLARIFYIEAMRQSERQRNWTASLGQRIAVQRLAHLLCEIFERMEEIGLTDGGICPFPATQADIAETAGMSAVHVNRSLQDLRAARLIRLDGKRLMIGDLEKLRHTAVLPPIARSVRKPVRADDVPSMSVGGNGRTSHAPGAGTLSP